MNNLAELRSKQGAVTSVGYDFESSFRHLVEREEVDCFIVSTEDGFSPLGSARAFFSEELGVEENEIRNLADWNRFENEEISLIGIPRRNPSSRLRGVVLAASETSRCYKQFATPFYGKPYRDFYYNLSYESIAFSSNILKAKKLAISHLSGSGHFHEDIATCVAEALAHFCDNRNNPKIDSFLFVGCCIEEAHLIGIQRLILESNLTRHKNIRLGKSLRNGFEVISLDLK